MTGSRVISVLFDGSTRAYDYLADFDVRVGDRVIVDTRRGEAEVEVIEIKAASDRATVHAKRKVLF